MAKTPTFPLIIDRCLTVSIADLKRWGCLKPGNYRSGTVYWERGGEREASDPAILPGMWKHLSEKLDRPFVGETGIYIGNIEKNASPLMALALVLINRNLLKERLKLSQTDIYRVLCKYFERSK